MADELKENLEQETKPSKKKSKLFWALLASGIGAVIIAVVLLVVFLIPKEEKFDINLGSSGTTSSVVLTGDGSYTKGDSVTIVAQDIEGYRFVNWTYKGNVVSDEREYTFVIGESTQGEYTANYARVYKIKASENQYGTFTINPTSAIAGEEITVEFEIGSEYQDEYTFSDLYYMYNGNTTENIIENNRFIMPEGDVKIYARLNNLYNINLTSNISDSVEVDLIGEGLYAENASATITAPYVEGYRFRSWTLNDQVVSTNQIYTIENINASTSGTYVANYDSPYQITIKSSSGDIVIDAFENDEMTYQTEIEDIIQNTEIILQRLQILADGEEIPYTEENGQYSFIMPASDVVIDVVEDSRLTRITDFMIMGNTIEYIGSESNVVVPSSYRLYQEETGEIKVYENYDQFINQYGGEGNPAVSQLLAGFYYKTKNSNTFIESTLKETTEIFTDSSSFKNPDIYPLTIKLKNEYTFTQEMYNELLSYDTSTVLYALMGPFMQVLYSPYLSNLAISFTYQIGDAEPVDADVSNISDMLKEINESLGDGSDLNALLKYIPIKFTNIRYGNCYICEGEEIKITTIEGGFSYNTNITNVTISEGITTISDECFKDCTNLTNLSVPSTLTKIGLNVFDGCEKLNCYTNDDNGGIYLGNTDNPHVLLVDVDDSNITASTEFILNENCKTIYPGAFTGCNSISSVILPASLNSLLQDSLQGLSSELDIHYNGKIEDWVSIIFEPQWHSGIDTNLYIGNSLLENISINENINNAAFWEIDSIKNINIGENVSYIGDYAFVSCENLNKISFAENSQLTTIGIYTFGGTNLQEVNIPEGVTKIEMAGFATCANLTYVKLPSTLEIIADGAFTDCSKLEEISFPENLKTIGKLAFSECSELTTVNFAKNSQLQTIDDGTFRSCTSLTHIELPSNLKTIGQAAFAATGLTEIVLPASIESIDTFAFALTPLQKVYFEQGSQLSYLGDHPFLLCYDLTEIKFPSGLTQIGGGMFNHGAFDYSVHYNEYENGSYLGNDDNPYMILCKVKDKIISEFNIHQDCKFIAAFAFEDCVNLTEITIPSSVTQIAYCAFNNCTNLKTVIFEDNSQMTSIDYGTFGDGTFYRIFHVDNFPDEVYVEQNLNIETICFGNNSQLQSIAENAFEGRSSLKEVDFGANSQIKTIGNNAFSDCVNLTSITIPAGVTSIASSAFPYNNSISKIYYQGTIDQWLNINFENRLSSGNADLYINNEIVKEITINSNVQDYAFSGITSLEKVIIKDSVTLISDNAFEGCSNLQSLTFEDNSELQSIGFSAFYNCNKLTSITIPSNVTTIGDQAFAGCSNLTSISIPEGVSVIGVRTFQDCSNLQTVDFGENSQLQTISYNAFSNCINLQTVDFGENSQLQTIGEYAFQSCTSINSISIPSSVTSIGYGAFSGCNNLTSVTVESDDIYNSGLGTDWGHAGGLLANASTVKVLKSIVNVNDNSYLENISNFTTSEEDEYIVFTKVLP